MTSEAGHETDLEDPIARPEWWHRAVVYEVYPRSFTDTDGDGIGDLRGVTTRAGYLQALGVDAVWLTPFYTSPLADGGYDVADHRAVDPRLGSLDDFDGMVAALHGAGIKVIVDIVPNHTSERHPWFQEALDSPPGSRPRHRYLFRDGADRQGTLPPNDWQSLFGGSAWERVGDGQWYLHSFAKEQPDLNWDDEEVRDDFLTTLRFWGDRGVDGFRVDVAHGLVKDLTEPYVPWDEVADWFDRDGEHPLWDQPAVHDVYAAWRSVFDEYDPPLFGVAEAAVPVNRRARYASRRGLGQAFNFDLQEVDWAPEDYRRVIDAGLAASRASGSSVTWLLGCHDTPRVATRYGLPRQPDRSAQDVARAWLLSDGASPPLDRQLGERRARAAALVMLALPGSAYLYQGDELGLHEVPDLPREQLQDPMAFRSQGREKGRDGCRVPLPWSSEGPSLGFGPAGAHLPQPAWFAQYAVDRQEEDPQSTLRLYRSALELRAALSPSEQFAWLESSRAVLRFRRGADWQCVTNFGSTAAPLPPGEVLVASARLDGSGLPAEATAWVRTSAGAD